MPFRGGPRTVDEHIADIEEQLRKLDRRPRTVTITTPPAPTPSAGTTHTHDDLAHPDTTVTGGMAEEVGPTKARAGRYGVATGDYSKAPYAGIAIGRLAYAGEPDDSDEQYGDWYGNIVLTVNSGDPDTFSKNFELEASGTVVIAPEGRYYGARPTILRYSTYDIAIGSGIRIGDAGMDSESAGGNILLGTFIDVSNNPYSDDYASMVLVIAPYDLGGGTAGVYKPATDPAVYPQNDASNLPGNASRIINIGPNNFAYGENVMVIGGTDFGAGLDAIGNHLINIGWDNYIDLFIEHDPPPWSGTYVKEWINIEGNMAIGHDLYPLGEYGTMLVGANQSSLRVSYLGLSGSGSTRIDDIFELLVEDQYWAAGYPVTAHLDGHGQWASVQNIDVSGESLTYILDEITNADAIPYPYTAPRWGYFAGCAEGTVLIIRKADDSANTLTLQASGSDTIDGQASITLTDQYDMLFVIATIQITGIYPGIVYTPVWMIVTGRVGGVVVGGSAPTDDIDHADWTFPETLSVITGKAGWICPYTSAQLLEVFLHANDAPVGDDVIVDLHKNGVTVFTTQANRPVIADGSNDGNSSTFDIDTLASVSER